MRLCTENGRLIGRKVLLLLMLGVPVVCAVLFTHSRSILPVIQEETRGDETGSADGDLSSQKQVQPDLPEEAIPNKQTGSLGSNDIPAKSKNDFSPEIVEYPVSYDSVTNRGASILPALNGILEDETAKNLWIGAVCAIGYLGREPGSAQVLMNFLSRSVEWTATSFGVTEDFSRKMAAIHALGLTSGPEEQEYLRGLLSDRNKAAELCKSWNSALATNDSDYWALTAEVQIAACRALIFTRNAKDIRYATSVVEAFELKASQLALYENENAELAPDEIHLAHLLVGLDVVMIQNAFINDYGLKAYFNLQNNPEEYARRIVPYVLDRNSTK